MMGVGLYNGSYQVDDVLATAWLTWRNTRLVQWIERPSPERKVRGPIPLSGTGAGFSLEGRRDVTSLTRLL